MNIDMDGAEIVAEFPATASQQRFWYLQELDAGSLAGNIAVHWELHGACPAEIIQEAFGQIIARHEILRTRFEERDGTIYQQVVADTGFRLSTIDLRAIPAEEHESRIAGVESELSGRPFDLSVPGHLRVALVRSSQIRTRILIAAHHAVFDGFSIGVLGEELGRTISALLAGRAPDLPDLPLQYGDYALWREACEDSGEMQQSAAFWQQQLVDMRYFSLPHDRPGQPLGRRPGGRIDIDLHADFQDRIDAAARAFDTSPFCIGTAAASAAFHRVSGAEDISFGTAYAGRSEPDLHDLIGVFINPVVLRQQVRDDMPMGKLVEQSADLVRKTLAHGDYPFDRLVSDLNQPRDPARTPLVSTMFSLQPVFLQEQSYGALRLQSVPSATPAITHDIAINVIGRGSGWKMMIDYDVSRFDRRTIQAIGTVLRDAFDAIFHQSGLPVGDLSYEAPAPRKRPATAKAAPCPPVPMEASAEDRLRTIWSGILGRPDRECEGDFFELGGHSLLVLRMLTQVEAEFGTRPGIADFLQAPTLKAFAACISARNTARNTADPIEDDNCFRVIWLSDDAPGAPLVLSLNQPFLYFNLARELGDGYACANLHIADPQILRDSPPGALDLLVDQAADHARKLAGDRPVLLMGQCVDGVMAMRVAQRLAETGTPVDTLAMIDSWRPVPKAPVSRAQAIRRRIRSKARRIGLYAGQLLRGQLSLSAFMAKSNRGKALLIRAGKMEPPTDAERQEWEINRHLQRLVDDTGFDAYSGDTLLFATASQTGQAQAERFGWSALLPADVPVYTLDGWHEDALLHNATSRIADVVAARFDRMSGATGARPRPAAVPATRAAG